MRLPLLAVAALCVLSCAACAHPHVYSLSEVATPPRIASQVKPSPTVKVSGVVIVDCVVRKDGSVGDVTIKRSLDAASDQATVAALRQWRFTPARRQGKPVSVHMLVSMNFTS